MEISIETNNLRKEYPGRVAIDSVSFRVKKGTVHGFLGPNGAGKTTTMKVITGLVSATSGDFKINGRVGFLPENPPLYGNMTVNDYLLFVLNIYSNDVSKDILEEVKRKCGLTDVGDRLIQNLSKGFKQRVGIAQALIHSPEIIILDEPTVGLDPVAIVEIRNLIESLKGSHTILFSSHQLHEVELLCDEITLVDKGRVLISGTLADIQSKLTTKKHFKANVTKFNSELKREILNLFPIDSIEERLHENKKFELDIFANAKFDSEVHTIKLCQYLAQDNIGLVSFTEEKLDLEEIFKRMTKKGVQ